MKVKWILVVIAMAVLSCTKQENEGELTYLRINSVSTVQSDDASEFTKAAIQGTSFPTGEKVSVGLFVVGEDYTDAKYRNIEYTKPAGSDKFTDPGIVLIEGKTATVYAYYPYDVAISEITQIPVTSSVGGNDWMWATPVIGVSAAQPSIDLTFHHSLALVEIIFNVLGPTGVDMTNVTVAGGDGAFSATGTMDATDSGKLTPGTAATKSAPFSQDVSLQVSDSKIVADCLLVPGKTGEAADARQDFFIKCIYNGKEYSISLTGSEKGVIVRRNTKSTILLNIKDDKLEVVAVDSSPWTDFNVSGNTATSSGYTVTFNCSDGMEYDLQTIVESKVTIGVTKDAEEITTIIFRYDRNAVPDDGFFFVSNVSHCTVNHDKQNGVITVTDVTDNVTINLGYGAYIRYTALDRIEPYNTSAFGVPYDEAESTFSGGSGLVAVDGVATSIGYQAFYNRTLLTGITLPEEVEEIGKQAFDNCYRLTETNLDKCTNLKTIGDDAFFGIGSHDETSAFSLELPEGLEKIGASAFNNAKISSVTLPSSLDSIGMMAFYRCEPLSTITSKAVNPPVLGEEVFYYFNSSYKRVPLPNIEAIYVPESSVDSYKNADGWKEFSDKITAIQLKD